MNGIISQLSFEQFAYILKNEWHRRVDSIHVHHTWRPSASQWQGRRTVDNIRRFHVQEHGWADIAQHLTIGPDGTLWSGRHLDMVPASARGHNGNAMHGPFMIELVGDFDVGLDRFSAPQSTAAYEAVAHICRRFSLSGDKIYFHNDFSDKSCPGTSISLDEFRCSVVRLLVDTPQERASESGSQRGLVPDLPPQIRPDIDVDGESEHQHFGARGELGESNVSERFSSEDLTVFERHVLNTEAGKLSSSGYAKSSKKSIKSLLDRLEAWANTRENPRVLFFVHGGLVSEKSALRNVVKRDYQWWLDNGVYPIFFVWETGLFEVLLNHSEPEDESGTDGRGMTDWLLEKLTGASLGRPAWEQIKASAHIASQPLTENGEPGGARVFAKAFSKRLARRGNTKKPIDIHAIGHSAGAIFLCHFLPILDELLRAEGAIASKKSTVKTLALLAPACRIDLFRQKLMPMLKKRRIARFSQFIMNENTEKDDSVAKIYRRSLLYYVRNACEIDSPGILGLDESIRADNDLAKRFASLTTDGGIGDLILSPTGGTVSGRNASQVTTHGDFDNDPSTMNSVLRRIKSIDDDGQALEIPRLFAQEMNQSKMQPVRAKTIFDFSRESYREFGSVHALCIGIDNYSDRPLSGCIADANSWAATLVGCGAIVHDLLLDGAATKQGIVDAWRLVSERAGRGATVVIQYAGHGTQVVDESGDESDRRDEAWVPFDYREGNVLLDDEIGGLIDESVAVYEQKIVLFTDCCHSGTGARARSDTDDIDQASRFLSVARVPGFNKAFARSSKHWLNNIRSRSVDHIGPEIHYAGCQDFQSSYEQGGAGAFTLAATKAIKQLAPASTYRDLADAIGQAFSGSSRQTPNFRASKGNSTMQFFCKNGSLRPTPGDSGHIASSSNSSAECQSLSRRVAKLEDRFDELK